MPKPYEKTSAMSTILSEEELVAVLKTGAPEGMRILCKMYTSALLNVISRMIGNKIMAEDTLQTVWLKVWLQGGKYDAGKGRVYTWLLNIAKNAAIDTYRSRNYKLLTNTAYLEDSPESEYEFNPVVLNIDAIGLRQIVGRLEDKQRVVLELVYLHEYTHREAAEQLEIPLGTVKTRLRIAKENLRRFFEGDNI